MKFGEKAAGADEYATSKDPLSLYMQRATEESPEKMRARYLQYLSQNKSSFGGGDALSGALAQKLSAQGQMGQQDITSQAMRGAPLDYAERMQESQGLSDMRQRRIMAEIAAEKQRAAERKARKKAQAQAIGSTVGAIGGAMVPGGGAAGAMIGGGVGGLIGGGA